MRDTCRLCRQGKNIWWNGVIASVLAVTLVRVSDFSGVGLRERVSWFDVPVGSIMIEMRQGDYQNLSEMRYDQKAYHLWGLIQRLAGQDEC